METAPAIDGAVLRAARERSGLSQDDLARRLGMSSGQRISRWERGEARPRSPKILHAVADALNIDPVSLLLPPAAAPTLRWLRFAAGLSVADVAAAIDTPIPTVKSWEATGLRSPAEGTLSALAGVLGVPTDTVRAALAG